MTLPDPQETEARLRADQAKHRMLATLGELQTRLSPRTVAHQVWDNAVERGNDAAEDAVVFARARPGVVATALSTAIGLVAIPKLVRALRRKPAPPVAQMYFSPDGKPLWLAAPVPYEEKQR